MQTLSPSSLQHDEIQEAVLHTEQGTVLVLGAPGTGKTQLLLRHLVMSRLQRKIPASKMLCLTSGLAVTRGFKRLQEQEFSDEEEALFIGNIHLFSFQLLFINKLIEEQETLIDLDEQSQIISEILGYEAQDWEVARVVAYANRLREETFKIPHHLRRHQYADMRFESVAHSYLNRLSEQQFIDGDALIYRAFSALINDTKRTLQCRSYRWIAVDEVQDFAPLHLAFIDLIRDTENSITLYFADGNQSICSEQGANRYTTQNLEERKDICVYRLRHDYRTPQENLNMLRTYAPYVAQIKESDLATSKSTIQVDDSMTIASCDSAEELQELTAAQARSLSEDNSNEETAILLRTMQEVLSVSATLEAHFIPHFTFGKNDAFRSDGLKQLVRHLYDQIFLTQEYEIDNALGFIRLWKNSHARLTASAAITAIPHFESVSNFLLHHLLSPSPYSDFSTTLRALLRSVKLMNNADLWVSGCISASLYVLPTTLAKGLEFDNILLHNATADVYPLFYLSDKSEDTRLLYVGMSRARKRLFANYNIEPSYFLASPRVYNCFYDLPDIQKLLLIKMERRIVEAEQWEHEPRE